jgi:hypothetical protein
MKRKSGYEKFMALTDAEKDAAVEQFDRPTDLSRLRPLTARDKALHAKARRRPGRPRSGRGAVTVAVSVERSLLERIDAYAKAHGMSRAAFLAQGAQRLLDAIAA